MEVDRSADPRDDPRKRFLVCAGSPSWDGSHGCSPGSLRLPRPRGMNRPDIEFFERKIRPVLVAECYSCHSTEAKKVRGSLLLDTREGLLKGGDSGPASSRASRRRACCSRRSGTTGSRCRPRASCRTRSSPTSSAGSPWAPRTREAGRPRRRRSGIDLEAGRQFWAFRPPRRHEPPAVNDAAWPRNEIDRFVLAGLEAKGLKPVARRRPGHARPPALLRPHRPAADARGDRRLRRRHDAGRLRDARGSPAGLARTSASAGAATGSTSPASPSR